MSKNLKVIVVLLSLCCAVFSQSGDIHLQKGDYVRTDVPCRDAPFAAMRSWDGRGFGSPHLSHCTTTVSGRNKNTFEIENVCTAQGDGTPGTEYRELGSLHVVDNRTYTFTRSHDDSETGTTHYRYCAGTGGKASTK